MIGHTCARAFANIHTDIEPLRLCRVAQKRLRMHDQIPKLNDFIVTKRRKLCRFAIRHRHEMTDRVRITIHHQEGILSPRDDKMRGVIARLSSRFKKIPVARFLFEILDPPQSPERFQLFLRKFFRGHAPMKLKSCSPKSSHHFSTLPCLSERSRPPSRSPATAGRRLEESLDPLSLHPA